MYCYNCNREIEGELICKCNVNENYPPWLKDEEEEHYRDLEIKSKSLIGGLV